VKEGEKGEKKNSDLVAPSRGQKAEGGEKKKVANTRLPELTASLPAGRERKKEGGGEKRRKPSQFPLLWQ